MQVRTTLESRRNWILQIDWKNGTIVHPFSQGPAKSIYRRDLPVQALSGTIPDAVAGTRSCRDESWRFTQVWTSATAVNSRFHLFFSAISWHGLPPK
jgi:hypothetical protein